MLTNQVSEEFPGRKGKGCHFSMPVILGIVSQVENGVCKEVMWLRSIRYREVPLLSG